jgi:hypothetical protein
LSPTQIVEEPLLTWHDVPGSKLGAHHMAQTAFDLVRIYRDQRRRTAVRQ